MLPLPAKGTHITDIDALKKPVASTWVVRKETLCLPASTTKAPVVLQSSW